MAIFRQRRYSLKTLMSGLSSPDGRFIRNGELGHGQSQQFLKSGPLWMKFEENCHDPILATDNVASVIELFRLNYERGWLKATDPGSLQHPLPTPQPEP